MSYIIKPISDKKIFTVSLNSNGYCCINSVNLPDIIEKQYFLEYDCGLVIFADLLYNGWDFTIFNNPFEEEDITFEETYNGNIIKIKVSQNIGHLTIKSVEEYFEV